MVKNNMLKKGGKTLTYERAVAIRSDIHDFNSTYNPPT